MIPVTDLSSGDIFEYRGDLFLVLKYEHQQFARGKAAVKAKVKNLRNGATQELSFSGGQEVKEVEAFKKDLEYVYRDKGQGKIVLIDPQDKSKRYQVKQELVGEANLLFLKEGGKVTALILEENNRIIGLKIPITVKLRIKETGPRELGDTATAATKPATLETGAVIQVPMFIKEGDVVKVNTQTGEYVERVKS